MQTAVVMHQAVGALGLLLVPGGLRVRVRVRDVRQVFGRTDYLVEPADGEGQTWADASRVTLDTNANR